MLIICCNKLHSSEAKCHLTCNKHYLPCASYVAFRDVELVTVIQNMHSLEVTDNFILKCKVRCLHMHKLCCGEFWFSQFCGDSERNQNVHRQHGVQQPLLVGILLIGTASASNWAPSEHGGLLYVLCYIFQLCSCVCDILGNLKGYLKPVVRCVSCAFTFRLSIGCTCGVCFLCCFFFFKSVFIPEHYTFILPEFPGFQTGFIIQSCFLHPLLSSITAEPEMEHSRGR